MIGDTTTHPSRHPRAALRDAVVESTIRVLGAPNALAAKLIERTGCEAIYLSGAVLSASVLGLPDVGLFTLSELAQHWSAQS